MAQLRQVLGLGTQRVNQAYQQGFDGRYPVRDAGLG
jgi:hypothetical protein